MVLSTHPLIFIWKFWKIRSGHSVETCMSLICDFRSLLCPNAEWNSSHGMFTTVDTMYIWQMMMKMIRTGGRKGFRTDAQQVSESGSDWVRGGIKKSGTFGWCPPQSGLPPPPRVVVKVPLLFCGKFFYLHRIPWYGKIILKIFTPSQTSIRPSQST